LVAGAANDARADISFTLDQGLVQAENLLFNVAGLADDATTIQGITNNTNTLYDISSDEVLVTPSGGQARFEGQDGLVDLFYLEATNDNGYFTDFEANLRIVANSGPGGNGGTATVTACNQFGSFGGATTFTASGPFGDGQPCEQFEIDLGNGENFFVLTVSDLQLLTGVRVETTNNAFVDVRQIRIGGSQIGTDRPVTPAAVPEPGSLVLLGSGLLAGARAFRKRRNAKASA
jgi:hypothetical protein